MRHTFPAWVWRLALATSSLWACNTLTGADNLTVGGAGAAVGPQGGDGGDGGGDGGDGGGDNDDNSGGGSSGGSGGSGGPGSTIACSSTSGSQEDCRACCRDERRGTEENLDLEDVEAIEDCLCANAPSCEGLSGDCADCCRGICAGQSTNDSAFSGRCSSCLLGGGCPGLNLVCTEQSRACTALFGCFHECQPLDP